MNKRRLLLGALPVATALPISWKKPVVAALVLPAHARTSDVPCNFVQNQANSFLDITCAAMIAGERCYALVMGGGECKQPLVIPESCSLTPDARTHVIKAISINESQFIFAYFSNTISVPSYELLSDCGTTTQQKGPFTFNIEDNSGGRWLVSSSVRASGTDGFRFMVTDVQPDTT